MSLDKVQEVQRWEKNLWDIVGWTPTSYIDFMTLSNSKASVAA